MVVFTGCGHAGVVNTCRHATGLAEGMAPLYAVQGGFHLADAEQLQIAESIRDLKALGARLLLPGHCTGWRAKFEIEKQMPGCLAPSTTGMKFIFA